MTLRSRLRRRLHPGAAGAIAGLATLLTATGAQAAYTPALQQPPGTAGCVATIVTGGCAKISSPTAGQGLVRDGDDLYLSTGDDLGGPSGLYHYRRTSTGVELRSCIVQVASSDAAALGCDVVPLLPRYATRPALTEDTVYVGGAYGDHSSTFTGVIAAIQRDPDSGELTGDDATCRAATAAEAPSCTSVSLDRLGADVVDLVAAPDGSTLHVLARMGPETQVVTYERSDGGALTPVSCLANADVVCSLPSVAHRPLLRFATQLVIAPDGLDAYLASPKGVVHLARVESTGELVVDDCVGDSEDLAGICDKGPGDFRGVSNLSMTDDDQVIAIAYGDDSKSVVRLLRDASGTLTEAGCIGTADEDGCGLAAGVTNPKAATATPDGKNVIVSGDLGEPFVTLIAGSFTGLRPVQLGATGCAGIQGTAVPAGCTADVRGLVAQAGPGAPPSQLLVQDDEVIATTDGSFLFFTRGRAPGCVARNAVVQRPIATLPLSCGDPNGDSIAFAIGRQPEHGTLGEISQNPSSIAFIPDADYDGPDSFTYGAGDGSFTSAAVTYSLTLPAIVDTVIPDPSPGSGPDTGSGGEDNGGGRDNAGGSDRGGTTADAPKGPASNGAKSPAPSGTAGVLDLKSVGKQLKMSSKRVVNVKLVCRGADGASNCKGGLRLAASSRLLVGGKRQVVTFARKDYDIPVGWTFTVGLRLEPKLAALISKKKPVGATLLAIGTAPGTATPVQATVSLKR